MSASTNSSGSGSNFVPPSTEDLNAVLEQYEFLEILGRGGMGAVYKARQISLDRLVAIKILPAALAAEDGEDDFQFAGRFQREARAMAKLSHPNIIGVFDFGVTSDEQYYIVMEYIEGTDLQALIQTGGLTTDHVVGWTTQICQALQYAHGQGIVHRDIKPANVMVTVGGDIKIADFGLAKLTGSSDNEPALTMTNVAMGTPDYIAPEALDSDAEPDHRADLYAVGVMLYEMLTGKIPRGAWKAPCTQVAGLDPRYDDLVTRAMDSDPEGRFQNASEIQTTLYDISVSPVATSEAVIESGPKLGEPHRPESRLKFKDIEHLDEMPPAPAAADGKKAVKMIIIGVAAALVLGVGALLLISGDDEEVAEPVAAIVESPPPVKPTRDKPAPGSSSQSDQPEVSAPPKMLQPKQKAPVQVKAPVTSSVSEPFEFSYGTSRYRFVPAPLPWQEARVSANDVGGTLVVFETPEELEQVGRELAEAVPVGASFPAGATIVEKGVFTWENGLQSDSNFSERWHDSVMEGGGTGQLILERLSPSPKDFLFRKVYDTAPESLAGYLVEWDETRKEPEAVEFEFDGSRYRFAPGNVSWDVARERAEEAGGGLASIETEAENEAIFATLNEYLLPNKNTLLGGIAEDGKCRWLSGEPFQFAGWKEGYSFTGNGYLVLHCPTIDRDKFHWWVLEGTDQVLPATEGYLVEWRNEIDPEVPKMTENTEPEDPRLAALEKGFKARYDQDAEAPYQAALEQLEKSYVSNGIRRARETARKRGDIVAVNAIDEAKSIMLGGEGVPDEDDLDAPEELKQLNAIYRESHSQLLRERAEKAAPLYEIYIGALDNYITELTRKDQIDKARSVSAYREEIAKRGSLTAMAPGPAMEQSQAESKPAAPLLEATGTEREQVRSLSEWILSHGGRLEIKVRNENNRQVTLIDELPNGSYEVMGAEVHLNDIAPETIALFPSLKDLWWITLHGSDLPDLSFLTRLPSLRHLHFFGPIPEGSWGIVGSLSELEQLTLRGRIADNQIEQLVSLDSLDFMSVEYVPSGVGFAGMKNSKALRRLLLGDNGSELTDDGVTAIVESFPDLEELRLGAWDNGAEVSSLSFPLIATLGDLKILHIPGKAIDDGAFESLAKNKHLEFLSLGGTSVTGEGIEALSTLRSLRELEFWAAPLEDEALEKIADFDSLETVNLNQTAVSSEAVATLRAARPDLLVRKEE
ncbi:MAG: protein kinase [Verrucomicrobiales bacterium]|nr:protein kinase [Verrucomicrobiales bacterium]